MVHSIGYDLFDWDYLKKQKTQVNRAKRRPCPTQRQLGSPRPCSPWTTTKKAATARPRTGRRPVTRPESAGDWRRAKRSESLLPCPRPRPCPSGRRPWHLSTTGRHPSSSPWVSLPARARSSARSETQKRKKTRAHIIYLKQFSFPKERQKKSELVNKKVKIIPLSNF